MLRVKNTSGLPIAIYPGHVLAVGSDIEEGVVVVCRDDHPVIGEALKILLAEQRSELITVGMEDVVQDDLAFLEVMSRENAEEAIATAQESIFPATVGLPLSLEPGAEWEL